MQTCRRHIFPWQTKCQSPILFCRRKSKFSFNYFPFRPGPSGPPPRPSWSRRGLWPRLPRRRLGPRKGRRGSFWRRPWRCPRLRGDGNVGLFRVHGAFYTWVDAGRPSDFLIRDRSITFMGRVSMAMSVGRYSNSSSEGQSPNPLSYYQTVCCRRLVPRSFFPRLKFFY